MLVAFCIGLQVHNMNVVTITYAPREQNEIVGHWNFIKSQFCTDFMCCIIIYAYCTKLHSQLCTIVRVLSWDGWPKKKRLRWSCHTHTLEFPVRLVCSYINSSAQCKANKLYYHTSCLKTIIWWKSHQNKTNGHQNGDV